MSIVKDCITIHYNTPNDISNRLCVQNKTKKMNLSVFNMVTRINKSKLWTKHISSKCEWKFDSRKCNLNQKWNNDKCLRECKLLKGDHVCKKNYIGNPTTFSWKDGK